MRFALLKAPQNDVRGVREVFCFFSPCLLSGQPVAITPLLHTPEVGGKVQAGRWFHSPSFFQRVSYFSLLRDFSSAISTA